MKLMDLSGLSDDELLGKVQALAETERFALIDLLVHLGELDERDACQRHGYASVFAYLTRRLGYSESDAIRRVRVARAARRFPSILRLLARGRLHLVGVSMLQPYLNSENHGRILGQACGKSQREIERMAAGLQAAAPEPRDRIRALPAPTAIAEAKRAAPSVNGGNPLLDLAPPATVPGQCTPSAGQGRRVFTFAASDKVHDWFLQARDLLRHKFPEGRMEHIFGEALRRLVEQENPARSRRAPRTPAPLPDAARHIPLWVQDEVWRRDGGRCAYAGPLGAACGERGWLEFDHITPWAMGGRSDDPANIRLLCRAHNQMEGRRIFGARG